MLAKLRLVPPKLLFWRASIVVAALVLCYLAFAQAVVGVTRTKNTALALRFAPNDPVALAQRANALLISSPTREVAEQAGSLARRSLEADALNPRALGVLGIVADVNGDLATARERMRAAHRMSRRIANNELWLIEENVRRGDAAGALRHYDDALRTAPDVQELLFPVLTAAVQDPALRDQVAGHLAARSPWTTDFLAYAVDNSPDPVSIVSLLAHARWSPDSVPARGVAARLLQRLAATGHGAEAARYFTTLPGARPSALTDLSFAGGDQPPFAPVSWELFNLPSVNAALEQTERGGTAIRATTASPTAVLAARKLIRLAPGAYRLNGRAQPVRWGRGAEAHWELDCVSGGKSSPIWRSAPLGGRSADQGPTIPQSCEAQMLKLLISAGAAPDGVEMVIDSVSLEPRANAAR